MPYAIARLRTTVLALAAAGLLSAPRTAHAQLSSLGDIADIIKQDNDRFTTDLQRVKQDYEKFKKAKALIDAQSKRTVDLHRQTTSLISSLQAEVDAFTKKRSGLPPEKWGTDPDAVRDRARYAELQEQLAGLRAFQAAELARCTEAVKQAKQYMGSGRLGGDVGVPSGVDESWRRIRGRVEGTIARCNEAAAQVKKLETSTQQAILPTAAEPLQVENGSEKMVFYVLTATGGDGTRIGPKSKVSVPMPADRKVRIRAVAQTPMREKILLLGTRGGKTISVTTATQHELTYTANAGDSTATTSTRVTKEACAWNVRALSKKLTAPMATPYASTRYKALATDAVEWTIPPITAAQFSKGIREPLMAEARCKLEWLYERTGSGKFGGKTENTNEEQYGTLTIWVMPQ